MISVIARRELRALFVSPFGWTMLAVIQLIVGWLFLNQVETFLDLQPRLAGRDGAPGVTDLVVAPLLANSGTVLLLVMPLLTMRLVAGERHAGTLTLLRSAPVAASEIVLGKYLALLIFLLLVVALVALMPLSLLAGGGLDTGKLAAGLLGLALLAAAFGAIGLFASTLAGQPVVAAAIAFGALLLLWTLEWATGGGADADPLLGYLSPLRHFRPLLQGLVRSEDIVYFVLLAALFLVLAMRRLDEERLHG